MGKKHLRWARMVAAVALTGSLTACSLIGSASLSVTDAKAQLAPLLDTVIADLAVSVTTQEPFFSSQACTRSTGQEGGFTAASVRGTVPDGVFRSDLVAARLLEAGFELQRTDAATEVFGRRDGMWFTVNFEPRRKGVTVDVNTGCRAK